jgi:hypothetical protein
LTHILQSYEKASGQKLNNDKTSLFFSKNTTREEKKAILAKVAIPATQRYGTYLGLLALVGKSRKSAFKNMIDLV